MNDTWRLACLARWNYSLDNALLVHAAMECRSQANHTEFDVCKNECYTGVDPLPLYQDLDVAPFVYGVLFPIFVACALFANLFVVIVLSRKHMRSPTNAVLLCMAVAELAVGVVPTPFTIYFYTMGTYLDKNRLDIWVCHMYKYLMDALPPIWHNIAMWLTVMLAAQRYVYIRYPMRAQTACTIRHVKIGSLVIVCISVLCGIPKLFDMDIFLFQGYQFKGYIGDTSNETNLTAAHTRFVWNTECMHRWSQLVLSIDLNTFYNAYFWTRVIFFIVVPSILLITLNVLLIHNLQIARRRKQRLLVQNRRREARRQNESNSTSQMLVIIVSIFLIVNLPQGVFLAVVCIDSTFGLGILKQWGGFMTYFLPAENMLIIATYPLNFAIYCWMSSQFRDTFMQIFCRRHTAPLNRDGSLWQRPLQSHTHAETSMVNSNCAPPFPSSDSQVPRNGAAPSIKKTTSAFCVTSEDPSTTEQMTLLSPPHGLQTPEEPDVDL